MRLLWYWPFARPEELPLAHAVAGDDWDVVVQVVDRPASPEAGRQGRVVVVRDLPDVDHDLEPGVRWATSRLWTYKERLERRRRLAAQGNFDLVHVHYLNRFTDWAPGGWGDVPTVFSVHDVLPHVTRLPAPVERRLLEATYRRADALLVHHGDLRQRLADRGFETARVHVVPHQVFDYDIAFEPAPDDGYILFFGVLRVNKGLEDLLEAHKRLENTRLVIAGRGDSRLEARAREAARLSPLVTAEIGFISLQRKAELFLGASTVVLPYRDFESQSGVLHDAYAFGRPVVVTDVGALGATVREDGTGIVVAPADPARLAAALRLLDDPGRRRRLAAQTERVQVARSPRTVGVQLREVYEAVALNRAG